MTVMAITVHHYADHLVEGCRSDKKTPTCQ
jgi:hypothetical protein